MCRLYGFRATEPSKTECSLVRAHNALLVQARTDERGKSNADGWGIAYYGNHVPKLEKRSMAAFEDAGFSEAAQAVKARTVLAHVRRATVGCSEDANAHPFTVGVWTFAHNGTVTAFDRVGRLLERETPQRLLAHRHGSTDSELAFLWLLGRMADEGLDPGSRCADLDRLAAVLAGSVRELAGHCERAGAEPAKLNFLLTDGDVLVASRWGHTLHWVERQGVDDCEVCGLRHADVPPDEDYRAVVVASERISDEAWQEVRDRHVLWIARDLDVREAAIDELAE